MPFIEQLKLISSLYHTTELDKPTYRSGGLNIWFNKGSCLINLITIDISFKIDNL